MFSCNRKSYFLLNLIHFGEQVHQLKQKYILWYLLSQFLVNLSQILKPCHDNILNKEVNVFDFPKILFEAVSLYITIDLVEIINMD